MALSRNRKKEQPHWRPNFRNPQTLPDIKVVRTDFLLNSISLAFCLIVLGLWGYREFALSTLKSEVAQLESRIEQSSAENRRLIQMDREFKKLSASLEEVRELEARSVEQSDLLMDIASHQPKEVVLQSLSVSQNTSGKGKSAKEQLVLTLRGTVTDSAATPGPQIITDYRNSFATVPSLEGRVTSTDLSSFARDDAQGLYNFTIRVVVDEPQQG